MRKAVESGGSRKRRASFVWLSTALSTRNFVLKRGVSREVAGSIPLSGNVPDARKIPKKSLLLNSSSL